MVMKYKDELQNSILYNGKLENIICGYANIWADVLCNKNLKNHLKEIEFDILLLDVVVEFYRKKDSYRFLKIRNDLIKLRGIIETKINRQ